MQAQALAKHRQDSAPPGFACPSCNSAPPLGALWRCGQCGQAFDTFMTGGACPHCGAQFNLTQCLDCGTKMTSERILRLKRSGNFVRELLLALILTFSPGEKEQLSRVSIIRQLVRLILSRVFPKTRRTWKPSPVPRPSDRRGWP
jgi:ABC-type ATPase with predicted acetyltransferase domain